jgi:hypothetical protein
MGAHTEVQWISKSHLDAATHVAAITTKRGKANNND